MYLADHDVNFFKIFRFVKTLYQEKTKQNIYTRKGWSNASTALGHLLMRRPSVGQTIGAAGETPPPPNRHVLTPINVGASFIYL